MQREAEIGIRKATSGSRELQAGRSAWRRCHLSYKVTDSALVPRGSGIHTLVCKQTHTVRNHLHWFLFLLSGLGRYPVEAEGKLSLTGCSFS